MDLMSYLTKCDPQDISIKTFFLGPQAENKEWVQQAIQYLLKQWFQWRENYSPEDGVVISPSNQKLPEFLQKQKQLMDLLKTLVRRFEDEVPKFSPRYVGHMMSEQSLPALLGHILTLLHNPNNISGEVSRVGIQIEREAIEDLEKMIGWNAMDEGTGHFTSGGTVANFEGLLRAKNRLYQWLSLGAFLKEKNLTKLNLFEISHMGWTQFDQLYSTINTNEFNEWKLKYLSNPIRFANHVSCIFNVNFEGPVILVSQSKHYSWPKGAQLLGMGDDRLVSVNLDENGRMEIAHLKELINQCKSNQTPIAAIISVAGTTELGTVDPLDDIHYCLQKEAEASTHLWHHIDAAYGGFLCSMLGMSVDSHLAELLQKLSTMKFANSITIDPHKLGYVPYASGVILIRNHREYQYQEIQAPYIQFDRRKDVGLQTLEGSRSAGGAVATWLTERSIGLNADGYGRILARTILARKLIETKLLEAQAHFVPSYGLDTNVIGLSIMKKGESLSKINERVKAVYQRLSPQAKAQFILSKTQLQRKNYQKLYDRLLTESNIQTDGEDLVLLRLCLMNPFMVTKESKVFFPDELVESLKAVSITL